MMRKSLPLALMALSLLPVGCLPTSEDDAVVDAGPVGTGGVPAGGAVGAGGAQGGGTGGSAVGGAGGFATGGQGGQAIGGQGGDPVIGGAGGEPVGGTVTRPDAGLPDGDCETDAQCDPGRVCDPIQHVCRDAVACGRDADCPERALCLEGACTAPLEPCANDRDCPEGTLCESGTCAREPVPCATDRDCPEPTVCAEGLCVSGEACGGDVCAANEVCRDAQCVPVASPECVDDGDCDADEHCQASFCVPDGEPACAEDGDCLGDRICRAGACVDPGPECGANGDCPAGQLCLNGACVAAPPPCRADTDCAGDEVCVGGACVPDLPGCLNDADCPVNQVCTQGACVVRPAECANNADCRAPEICVQGDCVAPPPECVVDGDCPAGEVCRVNVCVADARPCDADLDCAVGTVCLNGQCSVPGPGPAARACNPRAQDPGCPDTQLCLPTQACAADAVNCRGVCAPSTCDACTPSDACGGPASTCIPGHPAAFCAAAGAAGLGDDCNLNENVHCRAGLSCVFGVCRQPCGGAECGAGSVACPANERCADFSGVNGGREFSFCIDDCDPFAQQGCGLNESCMFSYYDEPSDEVIGFCSDAAPSGRWVQNQPCVPAADHFWGDCRGDFLCSADLTPGEAICYGFCTVNDQHNCTGVSHCALGTLDLDPGVGLCIGNCDPWGGPPVCLAGETCQFAAVGQARDGDDVFSGLCMAGAGTGQPGDACETDPVTGGSDCMTGAVCADTGDFFGPTCVQLCDTTGEAGHACPAGQTCTVNVFGGARPQGVSPTLGACL